LVLEIRQFDKVRPMLVILLAGVISSWLGWSEDSVLGFESNPTVISDPPASDELAWQALHERAQQAFASLDYEAAVKAGYEELTVAEKLGGSDARLVSTLELLASALLYENKLEQSEKAYQRAISIELKRQPQSVQRIATLNYGIALVHVSQDKLNESEEELRKAEALLSQVVAPLPTGVVSTVLDSFGYPLTDLLASTRFYLGDVLKRQKRYPDAEGAYNQAIATQQAYGQAEGEYVVRSLIALGNEKCLQSQYVQAEPPLRQALYILDKSEQPDRSLLYECLSSLSSSCQEQGKIIDSEQFFKRAEALSGLGATNKATVHQRKIGKPTSISKQDSLVAAYLKNKNYDEALGAVQQLITMLGQVKDVIPQGLDHYVWTLSSHFLFSDKPNKAIQLDRSYLALNESRYGVDDPRLVSCLNILGNVLEHEKEYQEAEAVYKRALKLKGGNTPDDSILMNLTSIYQAEKKWQEAEAICKERIARTVSEDGADSKSSSQPIYALGCIYRDQGLHDKAETCFRKAVALDESSYGPDSGFLGPSLSSLAMILQDQKKYDEAISLFQRLVKIHQSVNDQFSQAMPGFKKNDVLLTFNLEALGDCYAASGRYDQALDALNQALTLNVQDVGPDAPIVGQNWYKLAKVCDAVGDCAEAEAKFKRAISILKKGRKDDSAIFDECVQSFAQFLRKRNRNSDAERVEQAGAALSK
jgi:tetratricopeptide (TPR) repeat protein